MNRRAFLYGLTLGTLSALLAAEAQQAGEGVSDRDGHQRRRRRTRLRGEPGTAGRERGGYHLPLIRGGVR
jgi:hypothetical protein